MATTSPEKEIQNSIIDYLKLKGILCWPTNNGGIFDPNKKIFRRPGKHYLKGVSDIIGLLKGGRLLAIEVKTKTGRPTPEQSQFIELIKAMGGISGIARSIEDVQIILDSQAPQSLEQRSDLQQFLDESLAEEVRKK